MKIIMKAGSLLALVTIMASSCSVEYKNRHGKHNVIDVGMNQKELKHSSAAVSAVSNNSTIAVAGR